MLDQHLEQLVLARRQVHVLAGDGTPARRDVDDDRAERQRPVGRPPARRRAAAGHRTGPELIHAERLGHVVVGAGLQRGDLVPLVRRGPRGSGSACRVLPDPPDHRRAVADPAGRGRGGRCRVARHPSARSALVASSVGSTGSHGPRGSGRLPRGSCVVLDEEDVGRRSSAVRHVGGHVGRDQASRRSPARRARSCWRPRSRPSPRPGRGRCSVRSPSPLRAPTAARGTR